MNKDRKPLLTIHVSVFNLDRYIEQCLDSILTQDFDDYELILVDNGSTDRSIEICEGYATRYPDKIKYKKLPLPTIIGRPFIYALSEMQGEYFMSVDGDDYLTDGCLRRIVGIINDKHPDTIMGTFICDIDPGCSAFRDARFDPSKLNDVPYSEAIDYLATVPNFHTVQWRFIVKSNILKFTADFTEFYASHIKVYDKLINESTYGDMINVLNILSNSRTLVFMETPFYVYRCRTSSLSSLRVGNRTASGFLVGLISIKTWFSNDKNRNIQALLKAQLQKFINLYATVCTTVNDEGYAKMAEIIDAFLEDFLELREYNIQLITELCDLVDRHGALEGLLMFKRQQEDKLFMDIKTFNTKSVYVFPTGISGESTLLMLKNWGFRIKGFLDNDPTKEGQLYQGYSCMQPECLRSFTEEQNQDSLVVIATAYERLISVLKEQLLDLGISDGQIVIRK